MDAEPVFITGSVFSWESLLAVSIIVAAWFVCRRINVMKRPVCNGGCAGCCPISKEMLEAGLISLRRTKEGQKARIAHVQASGELGRRIRDMGLIPGAEVEVVGRAPLRDPVALRLPGFTLSLRNNEADYIVVEPLEQAG